MVLLNHLVEAALVVEAIVELRIQNGMLIAHVLGLRRTRVVNLLISKDLLLFVRR